MVIFFRFCVFGVLGKVGGLGVFLFDFVFCVLEDRFLCFVDGGGVEESDVGNCIVLWFSLGRKVKCYW